MFAIFRQKDAFQVSQRTRDVPFTFMELYLLNTMPDVEE